MPLPMRVYRPAAGLHRTPNAGRRSGTRSGAAPPHSVRVDERAVYLREGPPLRAGKLVGRIDCGKKPGVGRRVLSRLHVSRLGIERVGRCLERLGNGVEDRIGWRAQAALDLRQVRVRDSHGSRELAHRQRREFTLLADDSAQAERGLLRLAHGPSVEAEMPPAGIAAAKTAGPPPPCPW